MFTNVCVHKHKNIRSRLVAFACKLKKISCPVRIISLTSVQGKQKLVGEVGVIIWHSPEKTEMVFGLTLSRVYKSKFKKSGFHLYPRYRVYLIFPVNGYPFNADCRRCHSYGKPILSVSNLSVHHYRVSSLSWNKQNEKSFFCPYLENKNCPKCAHVLSSFTAIF